MSTGTRLYMIKYVQPGIRRFRLPVPGCTQIVYQAVHNKICTAWYQEIQTTGTRLYTNCVPGCTQQNMYSLVSGDSYYRYQAVHKLCTAWYQ